MQYEVLLQQCDFRQRNAYQFTQNKFLVREQCVEQFKLHAGKDAPKMFSFVDIRQAKGWKAASSASDARGLFWSVLKCSHGYLVFILP